MHDIFDLSKIKQLINTEHPSAVIIIDTNIIMDEPDITRWKASVEKPLYVLPCTMRLELEHLKNKPDSKVDACAAVQNIAQLCRNGNIFEGIFYNGSGWFISMPLPERNTIESEMERLNFFVKEFGQTDTKLIILAREISRTFPDVPLIFATGDQNLFNVSQFIGLNSYLYTGFPITGIERTDGLKPTGTINWDAVLQDIQSETEKKIVQVELKLVSKGCAPQWIRRLDSSSLKNRVIIAEGTGVIHARTDIPFSWTLPFLTWDFPHIETALPESSPESPQGQPSEAPPDKLSPGKALLDFGGLDDAISSDLHKALIRKLNDCASPLAYIEDMPTVQDPVSVIKQFLIYEFAFQERTYSAEIPRDSLEEFENKLDNHDNLLNWAYYWLRDREANKEDMDISFSEFLHAMKSCWSIGDTIMIDLMDTPVELTNLKGETEE